MPERFMTCAGSVSYTHLGSDLHVLIGNNAVQLGIGFHHRILHHRGHSGELRAVPRRQGQEGCRRQEPVSYTHLDVYKRQV